MTQDIYSEDMLDKYYRMRDKQKRKPKPSKPIREAKPEAKPEAKLESKPSESKRKDLVDQLIGIKAVWVLRNGLKIEAILIETSTYELILQTQNGRMLVYKHALDYVIY